MSRKKEKKVKKRRRRRRGRRKTGHYDTMPLWEDVDNILLKAFSL